MTSKCTCLYCVCHMPFITRMFQSPFWPPWG